MDVHSLAFQTDLMIRRRAGSEVVDRSDYVVVRTPSNPDFYWGNFLLFPEPATAAVVTTSSRRHRDVDRYLKAFGREFPSATHVAIGLDGTQGVVGDRAALSAAGLSLEVSSVLSTTQLRPPPRPNRQADYRPLASDADWEQAFGMRLAITGEAERASPAQVQFAERRMDEIRLLSGLSTAVTFGAFIGDRLCATLGLVTDDSGLARFQDVETHPDWRGRGLAGTLTFEAGRQGLTRVGGRRLVIVADPAGPAIGIYRSLGFVVEQHQVQLTRPLPP